MKHVAHVCSFEKNGRPMIAWDKAKDIKLGDKLYVAPKQWVGLTDEEIDYQAKKDDHAVYFALGALWAEAKLKEKNKW